MNLIKLTKEWAKALSTQKKLLLLFVVCSIAAMIFTAG